MEHRLEALGRRLGELRGGDHVIVVVDAGIWHDEHGDVPRRLRTTLRGVFADPGMIFPINEARFAVVARRHPGLALTVTTLAQSLATDPPMVGADVRIWCEQPPSSGQSINAFVLELATVRARGPRGGVVPPPSEFVGTAVDASARGVAPARSRFTGSLAAAAAAVAVLVLGAGAAGLSERSATRAAWGGVLRAAGEERSTRTTGVQPRPPQTAAPVGTASDQDPPGAPRDGASDTAVPTVASTTTGADQATAGEGADGPGAGVRGADESVTLLVVGMDVAVALDMVPSSQQVARVMIGVPGPVGLPDIPVVVALQGSTPGALCTLLDARDDVIVVGDAPVCDGEAAGSGTRTPAEAPA